MSWPSLVLILGGVAFGAIAAFIDGVGVWLERILKWGVWVLAPFGVLSNQVALLQGDGSWKSALATPLLAIVWARWMPWHEIGRWFVFTFRCRRGARCVEPPMPQLNPETMEAFGVQGGDTGSVTYDCPVCGTRYWASMMYFDDGSAVLAERKRDADLRPVDLSFSDLDD